MGTLTPTSLLEDLGYVDNSRKLQPRTYQCSQGPLGETDNFEHHYKEEVGRSPLLGSEKKVEAPKHVQTLNVLV